MRLQPACRKQFSKFAKTRQQTQRIHIGYANATESQVNSMIDWDSGLAVTAARIDTLVVPIAVSQQQNSEQTTSEKGKARSKKCAEFVPTLTVIELETRILLDSSRSWGTTFLSCERYCLSSG